MAALSVSHSSGVWYIAFAPCPVQTGSRARWEKRYCPEGSLEGAFCHLIDKVPELLHNLPPQSVGLKMFVPSETIGGAGRVTLLGPQVVLEQLQRVVNLGRLTWGPF